jgi:hypothetical protein
MNEPIQNVSEADQPPLRRPWEPTLIPPPADPYYEDPYNPDPYR